MRPMNRGKSIAWLCAGVLAVTGAVSSPSARQATQAVAQQTFIQAPADGSRLSMLAGTSIVLITAFDIERISITTDTVADALAVKAREILINGKTAGTISVILWGTNGERVHYPLVVEPAVSTIEQQLHALFPGEDIRVSATDGAIILSGRVSSNAVMLRVGEIAQASLKEGKGQIINMLQLPGGAGSQQVMLQVRFAEVNRAALVQAGFSLFGTGQRFAGRSTTQQFPSPQINQQEVNVDPDLEWTDFLNLFFYDRREGIGAVLKALESKGYFQSLAEPNLIAYNGQEASFLAGGEFPIPIVQGGANNSISVQFKEFGVRLAFTPTIAGDVIRLKVEPEVSSLDFNNGITLQGFRIPALLTRRAETDVELRDGQSFAIAGLLNNITQEDTAAIPILSKLPIIGALFKSKADRAERTELMVLITPRLVRPLDPDEVPPLPTRPKSFLPAPTGDEDDPEVEPPPAPRPGGDGR